jgi:hypothetical protein
MMVLVIGADDRATRQLRTIAPSGVDIVNEAVAEPDWAIVATTTQRIEVMRSRSLAAVRVLEFPEIASALDGPAADALRAALVKMAGIGEPRSLLSSIGVAIVRPFVRRSARRTIIDPAAIPIEDSVSLAQSGVLTPMPVGARLDDLLATSERIRAKRALAQIVRSPGGRS